ncbi:hypothetical protein Ahy_A03g016966 isoform B [Arachis hypogaea]|uniref:Uncharacterized protein n=1 Tax=Arachis hypogaea TaxID=3818 RepID=A0A445E4V5_ARAHY|nr:hypothetical protein Ahy_A03g016966 isoform B [Arachis hypogaea]
MFYSETEKVGCEGKVKEGGEVCCSKEDGVVGGATPVSITGDGGSLKCSVVSMEKPFRRFTRSLLKRKLEDDVSGAKVGNDKVNNNAEAVEVGDDVKQEMEDGALVAVSKASTKRCPTSLKELLATGILEGVAVNYAHSVKVVTPTLFKLNASRLNKCPPEYIYLENGSTLRDVMNACLDVPLETLEEVVQKVIGGGLTIKKSTFCFNCRDANVVSRLFCNSCMELKECPPNLPTQTTDTSNCNVSLAVQSSTSRDILKRKLEDDVSGAKVGNDKVNNNAEAVEVGDDVKQEMEDGALVAVSKASTKRCPTSLKELLATGILEGVAVNYAHSVKVVTPTLFKLNASRLNKCPPEYIYLENGSTLRDVMNACLDVPLETLEEVVQKVIGGGLTIKKSTFCFNCRDANVVSRLFCNSCMELKECPPNLPTQTTDTSNCNVSLAVQSRSPEPIVVESQ